MGIDTSPERLLRSVLPGDVSVLDQAGVAGALGVVKGIRGFLDAYEARLTTRAAELHTAGESAPPADLHTRNGGVPSREAQQKERRAEALEQAPAVAEQLGAGTITGAHADVLANAAGRLDDETRRKLYERHPDLAADAARMTPEQFARSLRDLVRHLERDQGIERERRQRRNTRLTTTIDRDGMYVLNARLHPELGHAVFNMIDAETGKLVKAGGDRSVDRRQVAAEALGNLVTGGHQAIRPAEAEVGILVDADSLVDGPHDDTVCEYTDGQPAPLPTVRRMVCNGRIVPIIIDTNGVVLNAGRDQRLANRHQRRALRAMYGTCAFHGCDVPFSRCEIHHLEPFELGGRTDLESLLPLCSRHHHVIHEPGWALHLAPDRTLTIRRNGDIWAEVPLKPGTAARVVPATETPPEAPDAPRGDAHTPGQLPLIA